MIEEASKRKLVGWRNILTLLTRVGIYCWGQKLQHRDKFDADLEKKKRKKTVGCGYISHDLI